MSYRCFAGRDEVHAAKWADAVETTGNWVVGGPIGLGETGSLHITSADGRSADLSDLADPDTNHRQRNHCGTTVVTRCIDGFH
jgi:hypothetical protein